MNNIKEVELIDILNLLPDIEPLNVKNEFQNKEYDVLFCTLGFEERSLAIPEQLTETNNFKCNEAFFFEYSTCLVENEFNKPRLLEALRKIASSVSAIPCDNIDFARNLRDLLLRISRVRSSPLVLFDISGCSTPLLLSIISILLELNVNLHIVYSEAMIYHPTADEYRNEPAKWKDLGPTRGVSKVIPSQIYSGTWKENADLIVAFLTFKTDRTKAIIADIDPSLITRPSNRIIWIIGDPHLNEPDKTNRRDMLREMNDIPIDATTYEVCTFNYKNTLEVLNRIYNAKNLDFHINISVIGSKMQSIGIALFWYIRQDISLYFALPREYIPKEYSEGCKSTFQINFGNIVNIKNLLNKVGTIEISK